MARNKWLKGMMTATLACSITLAQPLLSLAATTTPTGVPINALQRLSGQDRYETAVKISEQGWPTSSNFAILAAGMDDNLVDALTAAPLAKAMKAPILLTQGDSLNSYAQAELKRLGVKMVYVTSGAGVIQSAVTDQLSTMGIKVVALGGSDRFATALNLAQTLETVAPFSQMVVATAYNNADALSVAGIAAAQGMPILLTDVNALPTETAAYINGLKGITHTYVVGGAGVVSEVVKNALPNAQRAGGVDRFETNRLILQQFAPELNYGQVYVTNGADAHLVDALAVAPLAAQTYSPVVMSDEQVPAETLTYIKANLLPKTITALGGESVVPSASLSGLNSSLSYVTAGGTEGSTDPNNKVVLTDRVNVTGDNVTVQNATVPFSIYVTGNNVTLTNLQVTGTIFLDPGSNGGVTLDNVSAANIVVLSGASNSIHLNNVTANHLINSDNIAVTFSGGGTINGQTTTPTIPPSSGGTTQPVIPPVTSPVTPPTSDGTTTPPVTPPVTVPTLTVSSITAQMSNATYNQASSGSTSFNLELSSVPDITSLTGIQISSNGVNPSFTINTVSTSGVSNWLSSPKTSTLTNGAVPISSLLGSLDANHDGISLKNMRLILGSGKITLEGYLSETGYNNSSAMTVTINLGASK